MTKRIIFTSKSSEDDKEKKHFFDCNVVVAASEEWYGGHPAVKILFTFLGCPSLYELMAHFDDEDEAHDFFEKLGGTSAACAFVQSYSLTTFE